MRGEFHRTDRGLWLPLPVSGENKPILALQPTDERADQQFCVEAISSCVPMFARTPRARAFLRQAASALHAEFVPAESRSSASRISWSRSRPFSPARSRRFPSPEAAQIVFPLILPSHYISQLSEDGPSPSPPSPRRPHYPVQAILILSPPAKRDPGLPARIPPRAVILLICRATSALQPKNFVEDVWGRLTMRSAHRTTAAAFVWLAFH